MIRLFSRQTLSLGLAALALTLSTAPRANAQDAAVVKTVPAASAQPLITTQVDYSKLATIATRSVSPSQGAKDLGPTAESQTLGMQLLLRRSDAQRYALELLNQQVLEPKSAMHGKIFSAAEFARTFGLASSDLTALTDALSRSGFRVGNVDNGRLSIQFEGTVAQVNAAFHTSIHDYLGSDGQTHYAPNSVLQIPRALVPAVEGVEGLQNFAPTVIRGFGGPVTDFAGANDKTVGSTGGSSKEFLGGESIRDSSFTASKYSLGLNEKMILNVRVGGNNYPATGSLTLLDENGKSLGWIEDITACPSYRDGFGHSCTVDFKPKLGTTWLRIRYSGDEHENAAVLQGIRANVSGTQSSFLAYTASPVNVNSNATVTGTYTTILSWYATGTQPTGSIAFTVTSGGSVYTIGTATLPAAGSTTPLNGTGTDDAGDSYSYSCTESPTTYKTTCTLTDTNIQYVYPVYAGDPVVATYSGDSNYAASSNTNYQYLDYNTPTTTPSITSQTTGLVAGQYGVATSESGVAWTEVGASNGTATYNPGYSTGRAFVQLTGSATSQLGTLATFTGYSSNCAYSTGTTCAFTGGAFTTPADAPPGTYQLTLTYSGNSYNCTGTRCPYTSAAVADTTLLLTINKGVVTLSAPTATPSPVHTGSSQAITLSTNLGYPGVPPTGAVTFAVTNGSGVAIAGSPFTASCVVSATPEMCTATVSAATVAALAAGTYTVTPSYATDTNYAALTGTSTGSFVITNSTIASSSLTASPTSETYGSNGSTTLTDIITVPNTATPASTDTVTFTLSNTAGGTYSTAIGSVALSACTKTTSGSNNLYTCTFAWTPPALAAGDNASTTAYTVTATFSGDSSVTSSSATTSYTINKSATTTTLTTNPTYVTGSSNVTFTTVTSYTGVGIAPTGSISFTCAAATGSTNTCNASPATMTFGTTACTTNTTAKTVTCSESFNVDANTGSYGGVTYTAAYSGDTNYGISSGAATVGDSQGVASTTAVSVTSGSPVTYGSGSTVVFSVVITGASGDGAPYGTVTLTNSTLGTLATFTVNTTNCTATNGYTYTCPVSYAVPVATAPASYSVTATYNSTSAYYTPSSGTTSFTVAKQTPTVAVTSVSPASITYGSSTSSTVTATLTWTGSGTAPTGGLTFSSTASGNYSAPICGAASGNVITCNSTFTPTGVSGVGTYNMVASYAGDANYNAANSTQTGNYSVTGAADTLALTPSPITSSYGSTTVVTLTATASSTAGTPSGTVTFGGSYATYGTLSSTTCTLSSGSCSVTFTPNGTTAVGTYSNIISATAAANGNYAASNTATDSLTITSIAPTLALTPSPISSVFGSTATVTLKATETAGSGTPTGTVTFSGSYATYGTLSSTNCTLTGGTCSVTFTPNGTTMVGSYSNIVSATVAANGNYSASNTATDSLTITKQTPATLAVTATPSSIAYGGSENFSATITDTSTANSAAPTGTVNFYVDGSTTIAASCTLTAVNGTSNTCSVAVAANYSLGGHTVTATYVGDTNYNGINSTSSGTFTVTAISEMLTLTGSNNGINTLGTTSDMLTATLTPAVSGVTVTFTDTYTNSNTGATYTATQSAVTNASGQANVTFQAAGDGSVAGVNTFQASTAAGSTYGAATSSTITAYYQGLLTSLDFKHNFSTDPGTTDGTTVGPYAITVTNFSPNTAPFNLSFTNAPSSAFSYTTNCPVTMQANQQCTVNFYYAPPYGDGTNTSTSSACTTSPSTCGAYEQATWLVSGASGSLTGVGICTATGSTMVPGSNPATYYSSCTSLASTRSGQSISAVLAGKALLNANSPITVTPQSINFGNNQVGQQSSSQNVTITNNGNASVTLTFSYPSSQNFTYNNMCPATLEASATCQVSLAFLSSTGGSYTDYLKVTPNANSTYQAIVTVTGNSNNPAGLTLSTQSHAFGTVADGSTNTFNLKITNTSSGAATLGFSNTAGTGFTVNSTQCGTSLAASAVCYVTVTYAPTAAGSSTDNLVLTSNVSIVPGGTGSGTSYSDTLTFSGTGTATAGLTMTSAGHNFGTVPVGSAATDYGLTITNTTGGTVNLTFGTLDTSTGFTIVTGACGATLANNTSCNQAYGFTPTATGITQKVRSLSVTDANNNPVTIYVGSTAISGITLTGTGQ